MHVTYASIRFKTQIVTRGTTDQSLTHTITPVTLF